MPLHAACSAPAVRDVAGGQFRDLPGSKGVSRLRYGCSTLAAALSTATLEGTSLLLGTLNAAHAIIHSRTATLEGTVLLHGTLVCDALEQRKGVG